MRRHLPHLALLGLSLLLFGSPAVAGFFGLQLFGKEHSESAGRLRYEVRLIIDGDDSDLEPIVVETSQLLKLADRGAADGFALIARARTDIDQLRAALYAEARYAETVEVILDGKPLDSVRPEDLDATAGHAVGVVLHVRPGPVFRLGYLGIEPTRPADNAPSMLPAEYGLVGGAVARSELIVAAIDKVVQAWRRHGYPFARIAEKNIVADHARRQVDVRLVVDPGASAVIGGVQVIGTERFDGQVIFSQSALEPGSRYDVDQLKKARERLRKLDGIESVRVIEGEQLDDAGGLPVTLEVHERKPRFFGGTASFSSLDGAEVGAYWGHRNLFGGGETLKLHADVSQFGSNGFDHPEFKAGWDYSKPGVLDIDTTLFNQFVVERNDSDAFEASSARLKTGLSHRFDEQRTASVAIEAQQVRIDDVFGVSDHTLLAIPVDVARDSRDSQLDPTSGTNAMLRVAPVADVADGEAFVASDAQFSAYHPIDDEHRFVVAGRTTVGSIVGASLKDVPATYRYFAGGGGSVRGFSYRSLSPLVDGELAGGLSFVAGSLETRWRLSEKIGLVPFVDVAAVSASWLPDMADANDIYVGGGVGLRYYTALGPLRLDVAFPLSERSKLDDFTFYVGLGQAF